MASIISHAAAGAAISIALAPEGVPARYWPLAIAAAILPLGAWLLKQLTAGGGLPRVGPVGSALDAIQGRANFSRGDVVLVSRLRRAAGTPTRT